MLHLQCGGVAHVPGCCFPRVLCAWPLTHALHFTLACAPCACVRACVFVGVGAGFPPQIRTAVRAVFAAVDRQRRLWFEEGARVATRPEDMPSHFRLIRELERVPQVWRWGPRWRVCWVLPQALKCAPPHLGTRACLCVCKGPPPL
jgi:hypothetical protein